MHFPRLLDRFWQNLRRAGGWNVQYAGSVEPQRRLAPHAHFAVRGTIPRSLLRQVAAATYHQVWWPPAGDPVYPPDRPVWDADRGAFIDPDTGDPLTCWAEALDRVDNDPDAMARDKVKRNVVELCAVPQGRGGRPSKALTLAQAKAVLKAAEGSRMHAYVVLSLLTGARPEELRALTWDHVDLVGKPDNDPPVPPYVAVWRSVRAGGDTKTRKSRRTLALPKRCAEALQRHLVQQDEERRMAGKAWKDHGLVFASKVGTPLDPSHVRRDFRRAIKAAEGVIPEEWTPRELWHSFVSLLSDKGTPLEEDRPTRRP